MVLKFNNYKKKIEKGSYLDIKFSLKKNKIMSIISDEKDNLEILKKSILNQTSYKGQIIFSKKNSHKYKILFTDDFGFYDKLSIEKNFKYFLSMFNVKYDKDFIEQEISLLDINIKERYDKLLEVQKEKIKILFSLLIDQELLIIESYKNIFKKKDKLQIKKMIESCKSQETSILILDTTINTLSEKAEQILVISEGEQTYYGTLENLMVIKDLAAITISYQDDLDIILKDYQYTIYSDSEIVVRESVLENVIYTLLQNDIDILQIRNLGERIKLYEGGK